MLCFNLAVLGPHIFYRSKIIFSWVLLNRSQAALYCYPWIPCFLWPRWRWAHVDIMLTLASQRKALKWHCWSALLKLILLTNFRIFFQNETYAHFHHSHTCQQNRIFFLLFHFLYREQFPAPVRVPVSDILNLVCRVVNVSAKNLVSPWKWS